MHRFEQIYPEGPKVEASLHLKNGLIDKIDLFPSEGKGMIWKVNSDEESPHQIECIQEWARLYLNGCSTHKNFLPVAKECYPLFTKQVIDFLIKIPFGASMTYGELAAMLGNPKAGRSVGNACGRNRLPLIVPCHRVVASNGKLGGYSGGGGLEVKKRLLDFERSLGI